MRNRHRHAIEPASRRWREGGRTRRKFDFHTGPVAAAFDEAFKELGAEKIDEVGVPFDPTIHEAAMTDFDENAEPDTVIKVFQYGVKVGDRLIRPATVVVSM